MTRRKKKMNDFEVRDLFIQVQEMEKRLKALENKGECCMTDEEVVEEVVEEEATEEEAPLEEEVVEEAAEEEAEEAEEEAEEEAAPEE